MGKGIDQKRLILIIRGILPYYKWLWRTDSCSAENAAEALGTWIRFFGSVEYLVTDQSSHFKKELIILLVHKARTQHNFVTAFYA